ncbi:MAG: terminase [Bacteroidales bacterium]
MLIGMDINGKPYEFIKDTIDSEDFLILQGGKRAGKTVCIMQYIYSELQRAKKPKKALIVTDTFARLRDSLLSDLQYFTTPGTHRLNMSQSPRIFFENGSEISFCCADRDTRGYTSDKDYIFFNECIMYDYQVVRDLLKAGGNGCKVFFDYNPYNRFYVNERYQNDKNKLILTYKDNAFCPKFARRELEKIAAEGENAKYGTFERYLYEVECEGLDSKLSGLCFPKFNVINESEYFLNPVQEILASDWGQVTTSADPDVVIGCKFLNDKILLHEYYYDNAGTDHDIAEVLKNLKFDKQYFVYETSTAGEARVRNIYNISGLRFNYRPCTKGAGSVMLGIRNLQKYHILATSTSRNIINEQKNYKFVLQNDIVKPADNFNHAFDALRYAYDFYCNAYRELNQF